MTYNVAAYVNKTTNFNFIRVLSDIWQMAKRNLIRYSRQPVLLGVTFVQPTMFVILFVYVFGGAIKVPGGNYVNYLLPGIIIQAVLFGAAQTGVGLSEDMKEGLIDRFRSLPMARSAVLAGRITADLLRNVFVLATMIAVGYAVGFRIQTDFWSALLGVGLALAFSFAVMWIMAIIGLQMKNAETTQVATMIATFPLVFVSSTFVPVETMPKWLQAFAEISPVTVTVDAIRGLLVTGQYIRVVEHSIKETKLFYRLFLTQVTLLTTGLVI